LQLSDESEFRASADAPDVNPYHVFRFEKKAKP
jgi:hypothetical protein